MIYEDKYSKKYYILMIRDNNLQYIQIKNKYSKKYKNKNFFESESELQQFTEAIKDQSSFKGCIINISKNNCNYLYLYYSKGNFIVIDLSNKKIIKKLQLKPNIYIKSIINWNNNTLILQSDLSFYIFDKRINKIISKYSNLPEKRPYLESIKTFISIKNNFYGLFADSSIISFFISN